MCFICSNCFGSCGNSELGVLRNQNPHDKDGGLMASCMGSHSLEMPGSRLKTLVIWGGGRVVVFCFLLRYNCHIYCISFRHTTHDMIFACVGK